MITRQQIVEALIDICYFDDGDKLTAHQDGTFTLKFSDGLRNRVRQPKIEKALDSFDSYNYVRLCYGVNKSPNGGFVHTLKFSFMPIVETEATPADPIDAPESEDMQDTLELTEAQVNLLGLVESESYVTFSDVNKMHISLTDVHYLESLNYIVRSEDGIGYRYVTKFSITDAGREYLAQRNESVADDTSAGEIELTEDVNSRIAELKRQIALMQRELIELRSQRWLLRSQS